MITKYKNTPFQPAKPLLVWDGDCGFCQYWLLWLLNQTGDRINHEPYQKIADSIPGLPKWAFREAVRFIETDGSVFSGASAFYQAYTYTNSKSNTRLIRMYNHRSFFRYMSDHSYSFISKNRRCMFFLTKLFWGKNPVKLKKYWLIYLIIVTLLLTWLVVSTLSII
ncbi:DCC1-like thiol-disulfide oxidoreductase family protein [Fulvivirga lutea]|uniref:DUF393 domain-containing protein n=1 Tax=Fulvivirga lutea TaxID=2810512 RepID=A0A974WDC3_9BACT|nr:DCC1-like thiol-disulfide oxidoreductase family protein [Fulvivirga lutea]QSE95894.1 DUF393 domain-containing protein [Fulvivirga lutea]